GGIVLEPHEYDLTLKVGDGTDEGPALALIPGGGFVLLDTELTPELEAEGVARDAIRAVQESRKAAGLDVSDRISLALSAAPEHSAALSTHSQLIAGETLAEHLTVYEATEEPTLETTSHNDGVFTSSSRALGTEKATLFITIDTTGSLK